LFRRLEMLYTLPKLAAELGVDYHTLRRWIVTGRIQSVTPPVKGKWSYLTHDDVNAVAKYVKARLVSTPVGSKS
jgi:predicted site-specific integrase-resolvase